MSGDVVSLHNFTLGVESLFLSPNDLVWPPRMTLAPWHRGARGAAVSTPEPPRQAIRGMTVSGYIVFSCGHSSANGWQELCVTSIDEMA